MTTWSVISLYSMVTRVLTSLKAGWAKTPSMEVRSGTISTAGRTTTTSPTITVPSPASLRTLTRSVAAPVLTPSTLKTETSTTWFAPAVARIPYLPTLATTWTIRPSALYRRPVEWLIGGGVLTLRRGSGPRLWCAQWTEKRWVLFWWRRRPEEGAAFLLRRSPNGRSA